MFQFHFLVSWSLLGELAMISDEKVKEVDVHPLSWPQLLRTNYSDYSGSYTKAVKWIEIHITCLTFTKRWKSLRSTYRSQNPPFTIHVLQHPVLHRELTVSSIVKFYWHLHLPGLFHLLYCSSVLKLIFFTWDELSEADIFGEFKMKHFSRTWEKYWHKAHYFFLK